MLVLEVLTQQQEDVRKATRLQEACKGALMGGRIVCWTAARLTGEGTTSSWERLGNTSLGNVPGKWDSVPFFGTHAIPVTAFVRSCAWQATTTQRQHQRRHQLGMARRTHCQRSSRRSFVKFLPKKNANYRNLVEQGCRVEGRSTVTKSNNLV